MTTDVLRQSLGRHGAIARVVVVVIATVLFILPALVLVATSWTEQRFALFPPEGFTLRWYDDVFTDPAWIRPFALSVLIGAVGTVLAVVLGVAAAFGVDRLTSETAARVWRTVMILPLAVPPISLGVGLHNLARWATLSDGRIVLLVMGQVITALPFVFVLVSGAMSRLDHSLRRAAWTLGASPSMVIRSVELPLLVPTIVAGAVFAFIVIFDEVVLAVFLLPPGMQTLPVAMLRESQESMTPALTAASTVISVLAVVLLAVTQLVSRRRSRAVG